MCFALYVVGKICLANETPMQGTRTGCIANVKKTTDHAAWSVVCGVVCVVVWSML